MQYRQTVEKLLGEHLDKLRAETFELVLLDEFVQIRRETLKDETQMIFVGEGLEHAEDVMLVVCVILAIQLSTMSFYKVFPA